MKYQLTVSEYEVWVRLGCEAEEQRYLQPVHFTLSIDFDQPVAGAHSDLLKDAVDYVHLTELIKASAEKKSYRLIEHLNQVALDAVLSYLRGYSYKGRIRLAVKKIRVPVKNLRDGMIFTCEAQL